MAQKIFLIWRIKMSVLLSSLLARSAIKPSLIDNNRLKISSVVVVQGDFGAGSAQIVIITGFEEDGKNGRTTIDYIDIDGDSRWAYLDQIKSVVTY